MGHRGGGGRRGRTKGTFRAVKRLSDSTTAAAGRSTHLQNASPGRAYRTPRASAMPTSRPRLITLNQRAPLVRMLITGGLHVWGQGYTGDLGTFHSICCGSIPDLTGSLTGNKTLVRVPYAPSSPRSHPLKLLLQSPQWRGCYFPWMHFSSCPA